MRTLRKEPSVDHSSFTSFYPSLAKLINGGDSMERNAEIWRNQELLKGVRMPEPSMFSPFSHASRSFPQFTNGGLMGSHTERNEAKNVLEYAQVMRKQYVLIFTSNKLITCPNLYKLFTGIVKFQHVSPHLD